MAAAVLKYVAPRIIFAWQHPDIPVGQVLTDVIRVFHHPALRRPDCELHRNMFSTVESWVRSRPDGGSNLNVLLGSESVRHGRNHTVDASQKPHSHGGLPNPSNFFGSASQSKVRDAPVSYFPNLWYPTPCDIKVARCAAGAHESRNCSITVILTSKRNADGERAVGPSWQGSRAQSSIARSIATAFTSS